MMITAKREASHHLFILVCHLPFIYFITDLAVLHCFIDHRIAIYFC